ncbi:NisI/SpaI family lantibiotic immunity lipoprotein [Anaerosporobacter sp.]|uniref:NisI/SpaI family lantibiotic immunity lipoprotein n=1 Tax=Anaerosporobacter sp. TaxID=1872529 RepID=UPI00286F4E8E|nr:NisI/SpaI family lantibiotic immunity lipoprotein [Anaerosporobacter sp.]
MNKSKKILTTLLLSFVICISLAGCSLQDKIEEYSRDKEQCYLNTEDVTQFSFKGNKYTILEDTVSNGGLGEWVGYIRQLVAIDEKGNVLLQEDMGATTFQTLADLTDKAPEAAYIIPFLNVYAAPNANSYLIVDVNGGYHKAVINENIKDTDTVFDFRETEQSVSGDFTISPNNATQLLCDEAIYQVTSETVSNDELGSYIDIIAESVTFNTETKIPLSKEDLSNIDWYGENATQGREQWFYTDIYEIYGTNKTEAVAVRINNHYYIAKRQ